ncbi:MAG: hypothetical protein KatS3mg115_0164 [Candidatus Poribacteria bacterium]|nr:MAG: hypothetical protein KatS3mg115_0164 [Candidatus Poribacteria bacterium]
MITAPIRLFLLLFLFLAGCSSGAMQMQLAQMAEQSGDAATAAARYETIIAQEPPGPVRCEARVRLARLYHEALNRPEEALAQYRAVVQECRQPGFLAEAWWHLGQEAFRRAEYESARRAFLRVILDYSGSPFDAEARLWLAATYERLEQPANALRAYEEFVRAYPQDGRVAAVYRQMEALRSGGAEVPLDPEAVASVQVVRQTEAGSFQVPPRDVDEARRLDDAPERVRFGPPSRPNAWEELRSWTPSPTFGYNPRELMYETGDLFGGEDLKENLSTTGSNLDDALKALGMLYYQIGEVEKAGACLERTLWMGAYDQELLRTLTFCYLHVGATDLARETAKKAWEEYGPPAIEEMLRWADNRIAEGRTDLARRALNVLQGFSGDLDRRIELLRRKLAQNE